MFHIYNKNIAVTKLEGIVSDMENCLQHRLKFLHIQIRICIPTHREIDTKTQRQNQYGNPCFMVDFG